MRALTPKRILTIRFFQCGIFYFLCCINHATMVLQGLWRFAIIRELPSPLMFAFIGEQAGFGASHLSDSSRVSVAKQPNHLPFALGRICFRPWSKAFSTLVKSLFD